MTVKNVRKRLKRFLLLCWKRHQLLIFLLLSSKIVYENTNVCSEFLSLVIFPMMISEAKELSFIYYWLLFFFGFVNNFKILCTIKKVLLVKMLLCDTDIKSYKSINIANTKDWNTNLNSWKCLMLLLFTCYSKIHFFKYGINYIKTIPSKVTLI